ncbi:MAG: sulfatase-like hydrolase/transferase [Luteolibacter sp.]
MKPTALFFIPLLLIFVHSAALAVPGDIDNDGLRDEVETNTGIYVSPANTGTNPSVADTDGDSLPDGMEITLGTNPVDSSSKVKRPNIIYILADDLGYGDVGCFGQNQRTGIWKFATPGLDAMAAQGAKLTHHYVGAPICVSSRCCFLQGRSTGHADVRDGFFDSPLPNNHTLAGTLKSAGYRTVHIGKAGLTGTNPNAPTAHPLNRGFDRFFGYLTHDFAHEHYPRNGNNSVAAKISDDYQFITDAYQDVYTSDVYTAFAKKTIIDETANHPDRPFFIYLSYDTPHFDAQYPPTMNYPAGTGVSGGLQWTGSPSYVNTATNDPTKVDNPANRHPSVNAAWYTTAQQYVTMIRRMDDSLADILQTLRDLRIDNDTLVVFTSDNGPANKPVYPPSFGSYGPFEGIKGDLLEGGIRVPTIAWWPGKVAGTGQLNNIREISRPCANYDWLATFAEMAGIPAPSATDGTSILPTLTGQGTQIDKGFLYFEMYTYSSTGLYPEFPNHGGDSCYQMQAIRIGDFKGLRTAITSADDAFRIYNVVNDPKESTNLAASHPDLQDQMKLLAVGARRPGGNVNRPYDTALIPSVSRIVRPGIKWKSFEGYWSWLPEFRSMTPAATGETPIPATSVRSRDKDVGISFEGYVSVPSSGTYTFQTTSDSGSTLWIHDSRVIDNDFNYSSTKNSGAVYLASGLHPFRLHYRHQGGAPVLDLKYSGPGIPLQTIPQSAYFTDGQPTRLLPDEFTTQKDTSVLVDVLANDSAEYGLTLQSVSPPATGTASLSSGKILYTPKPGFIGFDRFSYTAFDQFAPSTSQVTASVLLDNEIWLPLDEGIGTILHVSGTPSQPAGILGGTTPEYANWITGRYGMGLRFDGVDDQVVFPSLAIPTGAAPRTFTCWVKPSPDALPTDNQTLFSYGDVTSGQSFAVRLCQPPNSPGALVTRIEALPGKIEGSTHLNDGRWHHLAVVVADHDHNGTTDIAETKIYVDGLPETPSSAISATVATVTNSPVSFGGSTQPGTAHYRGSLDDVRIFPRELEPAEIQMTYQQPSTQGTSLASTDGDSDNDGMSDSFEIIAGTDPDDAHSVLKLSIASQTGGAVTLSWTATPGRTYVIEESYDLSNWQAVPNLAPVVIDANGANTTPVVSLPVPQEAPKGRFLRLRVTVTP